MKFLIDFVRHMARKKSIEYDFQDVIDETEKLFVSEEKLPYSELPFNRDTGAIFIRLLTRISARVLRDEARRGAGKKFLKQRFLCLKETLLSVPDEMLLYGVAVDGAEEIFSEELQKERMDYLQAL